MATAEYMPPPEDYPRYREGMGGGTPILMNPQWQGMPTEEQASQTKMLMDALRAGVAPTGPNAAQNDAFTPVYPPGSAGAGSGDQFALKGFQNMPTGGSGGQAGPTDNKQALLNALRQNPQQTIQAMQGLSQQMKGMPSQAQSMIYEGLGIGDPPKQQFDSGTVSAAASGMQVPGMTQQQGRGIQANQRAVQRQGEQDRVADQRETARLKPLSPQQMSTLYKWNESLGRAEPYTGTTITADEANKQGYRSVNPKTLIEAQGNSDAINKFFVLLKASVQAASNKSYPELVLSAQSGGRENGGYGGMEGANLKAAITDFTVWWEKGLGGVRMVASPTMLEAMKERTPTLWDSPALRDQKIKLLQPAVRAIQREKLTALMGLPPDPRVQADMVAALKGLKSIKGSALTDKMIQQFVYESGGVPDSPTGGTELPVSPTDENTMEWNGQLLRRDGQGRWIPVVR